jgi:hypothetical protein
MYLQEKTPETQAMRQHMCNLLLSEEETNLELAYQLIESGGMHPDFIAPLVILFVEEIWRNNTLQDNRLLTFSKAIFTNEDIEQLTESANFFVWWGIFSKRLAENKTGNLLFLKPYWKEVVSLAFMRSGNGGGTCYRYKILPVTTILTKMTQDWQWYSSLDLWDFELKNLFVELANLPSYVTEINLTLCKLEKLSPSTWQNPHIEKIILWQTNKKRVPLLREYFPNATFEIHYSSDKIETL